MFIAVLFISFGLAADSLAAITTSSTALTFYAVEGSINPPRQSFSIDKSNAKKAGLRVIDNAPWLSVSPAKTFMTDTRQISAAANITWLTAGTYHAIIRLKVGSRAIRKVFVTLVITPPLPPTQPGTSVATLAWDPLNDSTLYGYKVYIGTTPGLYTRAITVESTPSATIDSLSAGTMYYFAVSAYNGAGESPVSNEVSTVIY